MAAAWPVRAITTAERRTANCIVEFFVRNKQIKEMRMSLSVVKLLLMSEYAREVSWLTVG